MSTQRTIGFIGLGVMGEPMCRNLATKSGQRVLCHDLSPAPMQRLSEYGAQPCADVAELMQASDVVMICLPSGKAVTELIARLLPHVRQGQVFVDLSTSGVDVARHSEALLRAKGARFIDTPIARTRQAAENGTLLIMAGGDAATIDEVRPLLQCVATDITHCGPIGAGQMTKILNNMVMFQTGLALSEAYAIAQRAGFDANTIFGTLSQGSGDSFALRNHGMKAILPGEFPMRAFSVQYARKDLSYAISMARDMGITVRGCDAVDETFRSAIDAGQGDRYWPVISRVIDGTAAPTTPQERAPA
ncbi:NAD(P)-dependent oxidoreductase [Caenimonas sp. DR4.4]|uniref:NAD(P)-dependent oxidoreductase n=1 Tax=Caenimonas aquaedulcis TaxID=2793270 RepID=A0A931H0R7_9BURK|nr:NAD(P)-dependent oxidoreductase [Caenimonas aquaedulcis]